MSDKMREALLAAKKIIANPHGYTETSVLVAESLIGQAAQSVPVMGEAVAWAWNYSGMIVTTDKAKADAIATLADSGEFRQHNVKVRCLYEKPTTSITQAELDAKDARIRELEFVIEEIIRINHYDFRGHEIAHAVIAKENGK